MSAWAWNRRRVNKWRVRSDLAALNSGGIGALLVSLGKPEKWKWRRKFLKKYSPYTTPANYRPRLALVR